MLVGQNDFCALAYLLKPTTGAEKNQQAIETLAGQNLV
jgi:hypothetical protein